MKMDYSFAPLYVRIVFLFLLGAVTAGVVYVWTKKRKRMVRLVASLIPLLIFTVIACSTIYSLLNPNVQTVTCIFVEEQRSGDLINPFSNDCELQCDGKTIWIELDTLTRNKVLGNINELEIGKAYIVTYEVRENLILGIKEN